MLFFPIISLMAVKESFYKQHRKYSKRVEAKEKCNAIIGYIGKRMTDL
jgi:hypothetical protein